MFQTYFTKKNEQILKTWNNANKGAEKKKKINKAPLVKEIREFFSEHLPSYFEVISGAATDSFGHRVNDIDSLIYYSFHSKILEMMEKAAVVEHIFGAVFILPNVTIEELNLLLKKIASFKELSPRNNIEKKGENRKIPAAIIGFESKLSFAQLKDYIIKYYRNNEIINAYEVDLLAILNHSIIIKDWHDKSKKYKALETKKDTLMWLFILFQEYILGSSESSNLGFNYREYIKSPKQYNEY